MALSKNPKYDLKRTYNRVLQISIIISLSLLILAFKFFPDVEISDIDYKIEKKEYDRVVPPTKFKEKPPPPPKPIIPIESPTDELLDDFLIKSTELFQNEDVGDPKPIKVDESLDSEIFDFIVLEEKPEPIGGIGAILKQITYPELAIRAGIKGIVSVKAFLDEEGNVFKVELLRGIGGGCDEVAMAAVKNTRFTPGKQRGKSVKVQMTVPVRFKLQ